MLLSLTFLAAGCGARDSAGKKQAAVTPEKIVVQAPIGPPTTPLFKLAKDGLPDGTKLELIIYNYYCCLI